MHKLVQDLSSYMSHVPFVKSYVHDICVFVTLSLLDNPLCDVVTPGMYGWTALGQLFISLAKKVFSQVPLIKGNLSTSWYRKFRKNYTNAPITTNAPMSDMPLVHSFKEILFPIPDN